MNLNFLDEEKTKKTYISNEEWSERLNNIKVSK